MAKRENIVFIGPTAVGKTGLASSILMKALQNGLRCQFKKAQDLFDDMYASLADRSTRRLVDRLARLDILLIDELGYTNLKPEQANVFFKLMEERYHRRSTMEFRRPSAQRLCMRPSVLAVKATLRASCAWP